MHTQSPTQILLKRAGVMLSTDWLDLRTEVKIKPWPIIYAHFALFVSCFPFEFVVKLHKILATQNKLTRPVISQNIKYICRIVAFLLFLEI